MKPPRRPRFPRPEEPEIQAGGEEDPDFPEQLASHRPRQRNRAGRLLPLLIFAGFGLFVLKEQVPAVDDAFQSFVHPDAFRAIEVCREAALAGSADPDFARLLEHGRANRTRNGFFVDRLLIGELERGKGEVRRAIECHVDSAGNLVDISRHDAATAVPSEAQSTEAGRHVSD